MLEPSKAERPCDKIFHFVRCGVVVLLYGIGIRHTSTYSTLHLLRHIYGSQGRMVNADRFGDTKQN